MPYYFQHPKHTGNHKEPIGDTEAEALDELQSVYGFELEDVLDLCLDGYVVEEAPATIGG